MSVLSFSFTKRSLESLAAPEKGRSVAHDTATRGLVVKVESSGRKTFAWYRKTRGKPTWKSIGLFPDLSIEDARAKARELNTTLAKWKANGYEGPDPFKQSTALTLDALVEQYIEKQLRPHAKTPVEAEDALRKFVPRYLPDLRARKISQMT